MPISPNNVNFNILLLVGRSNRTSVGRIQIKYSVFYFNPLPPLRAEANFFVTKYLFLIDNNIEKSLKPYSSLK